MRLARAACILFMAGLLAGCAGRMARPDVAPLAVDPAAIAAAHSAQLARLAWLEHRPDWSLAGRVAISNAGKGGSGRIDWHQAGAGYQVSLSAPVTRQSWRLQGSQTGGAILEGLEGGIRAGPDPAALLREATGWEIPVDYLGNWALARIAPDEAGLEYGTDSRLQRLVQHGWTVEYLAWHPPQDDRPALPARIDATRGTAKVRLVVDQWELPVP